MNRVDVDVHHFLSLVNQPVLTRFLPCHHLLLHDLYDVIRLFSSFKCSNKFINNYAQSNYNSRRMKKLIQSKRNIKSIKRIYIVIYDQQEFFGYDTNTPVKAFKTKKAAELYASTRNFEFQSICMLDEEDYESYVLSNQYSDYVISISDLRDAQAHVREEILRLEKNKMPINVWEILENIIPFKVLPIEYLTDIKNV